MDKETKTTKKTIDINGGEKIVLFLDSSLKSYLVFNNFKELELLTCIPDYKKPKTEEVKEYWKLKNVYPIVDNQDNRKIGQMKFIFESVNMLSISSNYLPINKKDLYNIENIKKLREQSKNSNKTELLDTMARKIVFIYNMSGCQNFVTYLNAKSLYNIKKTPVGYNTNFNIGQGLKVMESQGVVERWNLLKVYKANKNLILEFKLKLRSKPKQFTNDNAENK